PEPECDFIKAAAPFVTYGWGMIPVRVTIGSTTWPTALWPKDGGYIVPLRADARRKEKLELGDVVAISLELMTVSPKRERGGSACHRVRHRLQALCSFAPDGPARAREFLTHLGRASGLSAR